MADEFHKQPIVLTREELYSQVWSAPMCRLAAQYGITGTWLAKICARLNVPCPPRGYWAKKAAGKKVVQYRLPDPEAETPQEVTITPAPPPAKPTPAQTEVQQRIAQAQADNAGIIVPTELTRPHRVIAEWLAERKRKAQEARHEPDPWRRQYLQPAALTETDRRRHRILDTLFKALERQGFTIKVEQYQAVYLEVQKERIDFQLREKQKQVRRSLTDNEKDISYLRDQRWVQELQPSGTLIFTIKTWLADGMRREWKDAPDKPLESVLPEIIATLSAAGPFLIKQRQERAEAEKRRWEEENRRYREQQLREQDEKRWQHFLELARHCDEAASARRLLTALEARPQSEDIQIGGRPPAEWIAWARDWLERFDPLVQDPESIYRELVEI